MFICGPMSGLPRNNYPAFHAQAARLRSLGFHVENPAENRPPPNHAWEGYMRMSIAQLVTCDAIALLPGWECSRGATLEHHNAKALGMRVLLAHEIQVLQVAA